jgi:hypothetical protein
MKIHGPYSSSSESGRTQLGFFPLPSAQPYAWTAAILVYELDARSFQRAPNGHVVGRRHRCLVFGQFGSTNGGDTYCGFSGKIFSTPPKECPGSPKLAACQRLPLHLDFSHTI